MIDLRSLTQHRLLGAVIFTVSLAVLLLWIPNDIDTGLIEKVRRRYQIGDMLGPVMAIATVLLGSGWLSLSRDHTPVGSMLSALRAVSIFVGIAALCLLVVRWTGPAIVGLADMAGIIDGAEGYRQLRDTLPWKITGFVVGGGLLIWSLSCHADGTWSWRRLGIGIAIAMMIGFAFDLPFDDLVLPPNGDL